MGTTRSVLAGGNFATCVALFSVAFQKCVAAADWQSWDQQPLRQDEAGHHWTKQSWQPQGSELAYDQIPLSYPPQPSLSLQGITKNSGSLYQAGLGKPVLDAASADQLSLADLPVDAESTHVGPSAASFNQDFRKQKRKGSLFQVLVNFFKRPQLFKILVAVVVMLASFFLVGLFARIAQFFFGIWITLKVLEHFENQEDWS